MKFLDIFRELFLETSLKNSFRANEKRPCGAVLEKKIKFAEPVLGLALFSQVFKQISAKSKARSCINFSDTFFFCFSQDEFLVHINENVSFQHVAFLYYIRYGNFHRKFLN